jgi:hypothetical protein
MLYFTCHFLCLRDSSPRSGGLVPWTTGCQFPVSLATWLGVLGECFRQCSCMLLRMDASSHGSFGQSETTVSILMVRMGGDDICGRDAKVLHGMIWSAIWGTFMLSCGLVSSIYVESRFFQFTFLLSLTPLIVILNGVIASCCCSNVTHPPCVCASSPVMILGVK